MMYNSRSTDRDPALFARHDRLYFKTGLWYFRTREGEPVGPFRYRVEAEAMLARFIEKVQEDERQTKTRTLKRKLHFRTTALI